MIFESLHPSSPTTSLNITAFNITNNATVSIMKVENFHKIINGIFCVLSFSAFALNTGILWAFAYRNNSFLNVPVGIGILFFSSIVTIVADLSYATSEELQFNIYTMALQTIFGIAVFIGCSVTLFETPQRRDNALGYHHENIGLIIWFITIPLVLFELLLFLDKCLYSDTSLAILTIVSICQKIVQAGLYYFSLRHQIPKFDKVRAASWFLKIAALLNLSMWLQSIMTADEQSEDFLAELFNYTIEHKKPLSIFASTYSAFIIDYRLLCCLLFFEHSLEIDFARPGEHARPFTPQRTQVEQINVHDLHLNSWRLKGLGYLVGLVVIILTFGNGAQYIVPSIIGPWTDMFSFVIELLVLVFGFAMVKKVQRHPSTFPSWRETSSIGIDVMVAMMGIFGTVFWILKGSIIAIWAIEIPDKLLSMEFHIEQLELQPSYLTWQSIKCFVRAVGVLFQIYFFVNIDGSFGRRREIFCDPWNFFYVPAMMISLFAVFLNSVIDGYGGFVEINVGKAGLCTVVSALYEAGGPIHLGFCIHLFLHFFIINRRMDKAVENVLNQTSQRRRNTRRLLTAVLEEPAGGFHHGDDSDDDDGRENHLVRHGRKNFFRTH